MASSPYMSKIAEKDMVCDRCGMMIKKNALYYQTEEDIVCQPCVERQEIDNELKQDL